MSYRLADDPAAIARRLIAELEEFRHVRQATIAWIYSPVPLSLRGMRAAAFIALPTAQGPMRDFFEWTFQQIAAPVMSGWLLDFVVFVDEDHWLGYPTDAHRERLVYHELCHVVQKTNKWGAPLFDDFGRPRLKLRGHDTEVFDREVERYGETVCGIASHVAALERGRAARASPAAAVAAGRANGR